MENKTLRKEFFKKAFKSDLKNPNYKKIKDAFLYDLSLTGTDALKLFNIVKFTKTGAVKKTSVGSVEKFNKIIANSYKPFKTGQTLTQMNVKLSEQQNLKNPGLIDRQQIETLLSNLDSKKRYALNVSTNDEKKIFMINPNTKGFSKLLNKQFITTDISAVSSDEWATTNISKINNISISEIIPKSNRRVMNSNSQKYPNYIIHPAIDLDLSKYQIYNKTQTKDNTNCLIYSLKQAGISDEKIKRVICHFSEKVVCSDDNEIYMRSFDAIRQKDFKKVAEIIETSIKVSVINAKDIQKTCITYGNYETSIKLAIANGHIFLDELTIFKRYAILNYDLLKKSNKRKPWFTYSTITNTNGKNLSSLEVIDLLEKNNMTESIPHSLDSKQELTLMTSNDLLNNMAQEQRPFEYKQKEQKNKHIYYANLENISHIDNKNSTPFMAGIISSTEKTPQIFEGDLCIPSMFYYVYNRHKENEENVIYFHNLRFAISLMKEFIYIKNLCEKNNEIYLGEVIFRGVTIILKDSFKLFSKPLKDFKTMFNLDESYLESDVLLLKTGMESFNKSMIETFQLSIFDYLTISSYSDAFFKLKGVYNDVYECTGNLRRWMSKAIYGGRVSINEQFKKEIINKKINSLDGNSLYPSAISRLCREFGMPKGPAKRMSNLIDIMKQDYYIVDIQITKINRQIQIPIISVKTKGGIKYINTITEPTFVTLDRFQLEDYILYNSIEFVIIDGIYYNEGFNKKFECINDLFINRKKQKELKTSSGNTMQEIYKIMLNSAYGKTIIKSNSTKNVIINNEDYEKYLFNNFHTIEYAKKINNNQYIITIQSSDTSYARIQCGVAILSTSKRIINEVYDIASTNNLTIYYGDTDSIHVNDDEIQTLSEKFTEKYGRQLIGDYMGQFHSDFKHKNKDCKNVVSEKSIYLGRKAYVNYLSGVDSNNVSHSCIHARMRGINEVSLINEARKLENKNMKDNVFEIYEKLISESIEFVLNPSEEKMAFKFTSRGVQKRVTDSFKRVISFKDEAVEEDDEIY